MFVGLKYLVHNCRGKQKKEKKESQGQRTLAANCMSSNFLATSAGPLACLAAMAAAEAAAAEACVDLNVMFGSTRLRNRASCSRTYLATTGLALKPSSRASTPYRGFCWRQKSVRLSR